MFQTARPTDGPVRDRHRVVDRAGSRGDVVGPVEALTEFFMALTDRDLPGTRPAAYIRL